MKTLIFPTSCWSIDKHSASERHRCDALLPYLPADKYDGTQDLTAYDAFIWQKVFQPRIAEAFPQVRQVWDTTDLVVHGYQEKYHSAWWSKLSEMLQHMDAVTVSTDAIRDELQEHTTVPVFTIPDGHIPEWYPPPIKHEGPAKYVWFGYSDNWPAHEELAENIPDDRLIIISDKRVTPRGRGQFITWAPETCWLNVQRGNVALVAPDPRKSNARGISAAHCGLVAVKGLTEIDAWDAPVIRKLYQCNALEKYHASHSADAMRAVLEQ